MHTMAHMQATRCSPVASYNVATRSVAPPCNPSRRVGLVPPLEQVSTSSSSRCQPAAACSSRRGHRMRTFAAQPPSTPESEEFEGLLPEEDTEVPGSYWDALNGNTKLGKAVRAACDELEHLNGLEMGVLEEAEGLLKKLGMKGSLFTSPSSSSATGAAAAAAAGGEAAPAADAEQQQQQQGATTQQ